MKENIRYNPNSGYGEDTALEMEVLKRLYPASTAIKKITDQELQYKGVDYEVWFGCRHLNVDTKCHHYTSDIFVFEDSDTRENYRNYGWTNTSANVTHLTDVVVFINPYVGRAYVYDYKELLKFKETLAYKYHNFAPPVRHKDGITNCKYFKPDFMEHKTLTGIKKPTNYIIKVNKLNLDEFVI